jgi:hypothetical protein
MLVLEKLKCCITFKKLTVDDNMVRFPLFSRIEKPDWQNPIMLCEEACALRDVFEKWAFKEEVIAECKYTWLEVVHENEYYEVLWEDEDYAIARVDSPGYEGYIVVYFLRHVLILHLPESNWRPVCESEDNLAEPLTLRSPTDHITVRQIEDKIEIRQRWYVHLYDDLPFEQIELSWPEWQKLKLILCKHIG